MKNACIVVKKRLVAQDSGEGALLEEFFRRGYPMGEIRVLPQSEEKAFTQVLQKLQGECENIFLFAEKGGLSLVGERVLRVFSTDSKKNFLDGAAIFEERETTLFLLSLDDAERGIGFAQKACIPYLEGKYGTRYEQAVFRAVGVSEERVESLLSEIERLSGGKIKGYHARKYDEESIFLVYDDIAPKRVVDDATRLLIDGLGDTMYAMNDTTLEEQLVTLLKIRGKKLSVAESFTGGGVAKRITSVAGASEVYFEGLNTYAIESKMKRLGVREFGLKTVGAVSDQTAYEMAFGLLNTGDCSLAIATTGLAGPKTDKSMLPVGVCFIAVGTKEKIFVYRYKLDGDRKEITEKAINYALFLAYKQLKNL